MILLQIFIAGSRAESHIIKVHCRCYLPFQPLNNQLFRSCKTHNSSKVDLVVTPYAILPHQITSNPRTWPQGRDCWCCSWSQMCVCHSPVVFFFFWGGGLVGVKHWKQGKLKRLWEVETPLIWRGDLGGGLGVETVETQVFKEQPHDLVTKQPFGMTQTYTT